MSAVISTPIRKCIVCGLEAYSQEDLGLFAKSKRSPYGRLNLCKKCNNERHKEYMNNLPKEKKEQRRQYQKEYSKKNKENIAIQSLKWQRNNRKKIRKSQIKHRKKLRLQVLTHYGGNPPICDCCGEDHIEFLTIDHIEGGGNAHRKKIGRSGTEFYRWLIKQGYPEEYRVLCYNCNCSYFREGYCPHKLIKEENT